MKFAKQNGVPIVAVMMEGPDSNGRSWKAGGWLGIITAGCLWTPLYDPASYATNVPMLLQQIELAVGAAAAAEGDDDEDEEQGKKAGGDGFGEDETAAAAAAAAYDDDDQLPVFSAEVRIRLS